MAPGRRRLPGRGAVRSTALIPACSSDRAAIDTLREHAPTPPHPGTGTQSLVTTSPSEDVPEPSARRKPQAKPRAPALS